MAGGWRLLTAWTKKNDVGGQRTEGCHASRKGGEGEHDTKIDRSHGKRWWSGIATVVLGKEAAPVAIGRWHQWFALTDGYGLSTATTTTGGEDCGIGILRGQRRQSFDGAAGSTASGSMATRWARGRRERLGVARRFRLASILPRVAATLRTRLLLPRLKLYVVDVMAVKEEGDTSQQGKKSRSRLILRLGALLVAHSGLVSVVCCAAGIIAFILLPVLANNTYISENALMPGIIEILILYACCSFARDIEI
ncbi:hypothetical protein ZIOFF_028406 [Zingiber officinale]|uniref:Uncharacterized protein n=1 Tax=Zingiber officinale TaxID=94328 RepID=A0A8J5GUX7_ZINOF|nr:hypothetical protein ZIOFF_028406 [Zingiber officinale]